MQYKIYVVKISVINYVSEMIERASICRIINSNDGLNIEKCVKIRIDSTKFDEPII